MMLLAYYVFMFVSYIQDEDNLRVRRHLGAALRSNFGNRLYTSRSVKRVLDDLYGDIGYKNKRLMMIEKRHFGPAMSSFYRGGVLPEVDSNPWRQRRDTDAVSEQEKRHLGPAMRYFSSGDDNEMDKRHLGSAMQFFKSGIDSDVDKRHLGPAMRYFKSGDDEVDKRHIGPALSSIYRGYGDDNPMADKRHLGPAMRFMDAAQQNNMDKKHLGPAMNYFKSDSSDLPDKRHLGSAMQFFGRPQSDDVNDLEKRRLGSALKSGFGTKLYHSGVDSRDKKHLAAAFQSGFTAGRGSAADADKRQADDVITDEVAER